MSYVPVSIAGTGSIAAGPRHFKTSPLWQSARLLLRVTRMTLRSAADANTRPGSSIRVSPPHLPRPPRRFHLRAFEGTRRRLPDSCRAPAPAARRLPTGSVRAIHPLVETASHQRLHILHTASQTSTVGEASDWGADPKAKHHVAQRPFFRPAERKKRGMRRGDVGAEGGSQHGRKKGASMNNTHR